MKFEWKRFLALMLTMVMVLSCLPASARAEECAHERRVSERVVHHTMVVDAVFHDWSYTTYLKCADCGLILDNYGQMSSRDYHSYNIPDGSETTRVYVDENSHNVVEKSTMRCVCWLRKTTTNVVGQEAHTAQGYGYDSAHPHQKYAIYDCNSHVPVDGQFQTANGTLQDADKCCLCHGHKFGAAQEAAGGTWQKTCANCGLTQAAQNPSQPTQPEETKPQETVPPQTEPPETIPPEVHVHNFIYGAAAAAHPHYSTGVCACGATSVVRDSVLACCQCSGSHIWGEVIRLPDDSFRMICAKCNTSQTVTPTGDVLLYYRVIDTITYRHNAAKVYQDVHDIDSAASAIWKTVAGQATDELAKKGLFGVNGFVWSTEFLNGLSDQMGTIVDAAFMDEETWDEQQTEMWELLLIEMLQGTSEIKENADAADEMINTGVDYFEGIAAVIENATGDKEKLAQINEQIQELTFKKNSIVNYFSKKDRAKLDELMAQRDLTTTTNELANELGFLMTAVGVFTDGTSAAQIVEHQNKILADIKQNEEYKDILDSIYKSAYASGNSNLANAVLNVYDDINRNIEEALVQWWDSTTALLTGMADSIATEGAEKGLEFVMEKGANAAVKAIEKLTGSEFKAGSGGYLGILDAIELGAKVTKYFVGWDEAYVAAQKLMTINQMDATMNIVQVLAEEDAPYMAELWGMLQTEGCEQAKIFLEEWEQGAGMSVEDFGIKEGTLSTVNRQLDIEKNFHINMLGLSVSKA